MIGISIVKYLVSLIKGGIYGQDDFDLPCCGIYYGTFSGAGSGGQGWQRKRSKTRGKKIRRYYG